jgi:hypothetical protein
VRKPGRPQGSPLQQAILEDAAWGEGGPLDQEGFRLAWSGHAGAQAWMTNQQPLRPTGNRHQFVFFVTLCKIFHLGGNNAGLHVDLSRFQTLNQPGRGRIARTYTHRDWIVGSAGLAAVADAPSIGRLLMDRLGSP